MLCDARNGTLKIHDSTMDYIRFGRGSRTLIILPGLGDALRTVKGTALPMGWMYRIFAKNFTVYAFSRKNALPAGYTTRDMARDQAEAMESLGIGKADIFGVSMGGMIAQHLAVDHPDKVGKLILTVTCGRCNPVLEESITEWENCAKNGDHTALMDSNLRRIYSGAYYRKNRWMVPVVGKLTKPKTYERFFIQSAACRNHDAFDRLQEIRSPTLVIGGEKDLTLGGEPSYEIAEKIPGARLHMYPQWGHGLYEEAEDFNKLVLDFLLK